MSAFTSPKYVDPPSGDANAAVPKVRKLSEIPIPLAEENNPNALFKNGWGRREHFALLVAPSGVGKSVISLQAAYAWALGRQGILGSEPIKPMKIGIIQAEDDDTEMGEFRQNHRIGFKDEGWSDADISAAEDQILDFSQLLTDLTGEAFAARLDQVLAENPVDVVIMNPLQSYAACDLNKNSELSGFVRGMILPILRKRRCMMLCVHHTNKPPSAKDRDGWGTDATAAYVGAGGAELVNAARSVTVIVPDKTLGQEGYYHIRGAKRGNRLGWKDADDKKTTERIIAYSENCIHWRVPDTAELALKGLLKNSTAVAEAIDAKAQSLETPELAAERLAKAIREYGELVGKTEATRLADKAVKRKNRQSAIDAVFADPQKYGLDVREGKDSRNRQILQLYAYGADVENHLEDMVF